MGKRWIAFILSAVFLFSMPVLADETLYADICPLNTDVSVLWGADAPMLSISVFNASAHTVVSFDYSVTLLSTGVSGGSVFRSHVENISVDAYEPGNIVQALPAYTSVISCRNFRIEKILFSDGAVWTPREPLYAAAYFYALGQRTANDAYVLDAQHGLKLVDYSYSSTSRAWYIWDDAAGWVLFSHELQPTCYIWRDHAVIKLVINNDPSLYCIQTFRVVSIPDTVQMMAYATGDVTAAAPVLQEDTFAPKTSVGISAAFTVPYKMKGTPCVLGLWDTNAQTTSRAWYIWDGAEWVLFSVDRGPACEIWKTGTSYIKLEYADSEAVYAIHITDTL